MITIIIGLGLTFLASYLILKPSIPGWNSRGFESFETSWKKIFFISWIISEAFAFLAWYESNYNPIIALIVGLLAGFFAIAAWVDAQVRKVPAEISDLTFGIGFGILAVTVLTVTPINIYYPILLPTIATTDLWTCLGIGVGVMLLGVLGFIRIKNSLGYIVLFIGYVGFVFAGYTIISWLRIAQVGSYWNNVGDKLLTTFIFISVIMLFDIFFGHLIGGADMKAMYAAGFALSWWVGNYYLLIMMIIAFALQGVIHLTAKPLNIGEIRHIKNGLIRQLWVKHKYKGQENIPTHYNAIALPFLPVLVTSYIAGTILVVTIF